MWQPISIEIDHVSKGFELISMVPDKKKEGMIIQIEIVEIVVIKNLQGGIKKEKPADLRSVKGWISDVFHGQSCAPDDIPWSLRNGKRSLARSVCKGWHWLSREACQCVLLG